MKDFRLVALYNLSMKKLNSVRRRRTRNRLIGVKLTEMEHYKLCLHALEHRQKISSVVRNHLQPVIGSPHEYMEVVKS